MKPLVKVENDKDGLMYQCQLEWPDTAELHFHWRRPVGLECFAFNTDDPDEEPHFDDTPRCAGMVHTVVPAGIDADEHWIDGRIVRGRFSFLGGHKDSWEITEQMMWNSVDRAIKCDHKFYNTSWCLNGDGNCPVCHMFVHGMYMDRGLRESRNLAYQAHHGQKRKYGGWPYITHPQQVYGRVNGWRSDLPRDQWIRMAKAAWLHDVLEDCPHIPHEAIQIVAGEDTYKLVLELTNPSKGSKRPRAVRKQMDREHIKAGSWEAKVLKFFDRVENLRDMEKCEEKDFLALYGGESQALYDEVFEPFLNEMVAGGYSYAEHMKKEYLSWVRAAIRRSL
jgi:hypothetical protein